MTTYPPQSVSCPEVHGLGDLFLSFCPQFFLSSAAVCVGGGASLDYSQYCLIWYGLLWFCMVGVVSYGMVSYRTVRYGMDHTVWYNMIYYALVWFNILHDIVWYGRVG
jgi:hypothetical protein